MVETKERLEHIPEKNRAEGMRVYCTEDSTIYAYIKDEEGKLSFQKEGDAFEATTEEVRKLFGVESSKEPGSVAPNPKKPEEAAQSSVEWKDIKHKPIEFKPEEHDHDDRYILLADIDAIKEGKKGDPGADGKDGKDGKNGANGKSAYEVAVANGETKSEQDWLASLHGENGKDGRDGKDGVDGKNGASAYDIAVSKGFAGTEDEWLSSLKEGLQSGNVKISDFATELRDPLQKVLDTKIVDEDKLKETTDKLKAADDKKLDKSSLIDSTTDIAAENHITADDKVLSEKATVDFVKKAAASVDNVKHADVAGSVVFIPDSAPSHNALYRGKDLTSYFDSGEMSKAIANATFEDIYPGDYIMKDVTIDGTAYENVKFVVGDLDYYYLMGATSLTTHHVLMIPDTVIGSAPMNLPVDTTETSTHATVDTDKEGTVTETCGDLTITTTTAIKDGTTTVTVTKKSNGYHTYGGYAGSNMWQVTMPKYATGLTDAFGADHLVKHQVLLSNAVNVDLKSNAGDAWMGAAVDNYLTLYDVTCNLMNEMQVYGSAIWSSSAGECRSMSHQIAAFRYSYDLQNAHRRDYWLTAVAFASYFAVSGGGGEAGNVGAGLSTGVRPYFLLK